MIPIKYTYRNLFERRGVAFMTLASIGFVVLVYIGVLALAGGLRAAFAETGDPSVVIVMRDGTRAEMESAYAQESHRLLTTMPGVERTAGGDLLASGETVTIQIFERVDGTETNVMVRGVEPGAFAIRPGFEITEGRVFEPGRGEIIVGRSLAGRLGLRVGDERELGRNTFRVVGLFAGVGAHGSEIWGDYRDLGDSFRRSGYYSSTRLMATSPAAARDLIETVKADQRLQVAAVTEPEYYQQQSDISSGQFIVLGNVLAVLMAIGACFAAAKLHDVRPGRRPRPRDRHPARPRFQAALDHGQLLPGGGAARRRRRRLRRPAVPAAQRDPDGHDEPGHVQRDHVPVANDSVRALLGHLPGHGDRRPRRPAPRLRRLAAEDHRPAARSVALDWVPGRTASWSRAGAPRTMGREPISRSD